MQLARVVATSEKVAATRSRLAKRAALSACLREAGPAVVGLAADYLCGHLPQGRIGLGPAIVSELRAVAAAPSARLSLRQVDAAFGEIGAISGRGSARRRRERLGALLCEATETEQRFLARLVLGELRQGALEGLLADAIADAASLEPAEVRRAAMLASRLSRVAEAALRDGRAGLARFRLQPLSPVLPMLAQPAEDMDEAIGSLGEAVLEYKLDGARVQIHKLHDEVRAFSRRLNDVTASLPEVVDAARALPASQLVLDAEIIALRDDGRPHPFQVTMRRFGRKVDVQAMRQSVPLHLFVFDCLHVDGSDLIDRVVAERFEWLHSHADPQLLVPRTVTGDPEHARAFLDQALADGHEGVMAKSLGSVYAAGNRGADWLKIKKAHSFDLVVLAAEWGSGRRKGWLSNLHLGARDPDSGAFVMLGKTFKGLSDSVLEWQTRRLLELEIGRDDHVVHVRPELVVEIAVNEIQASPHYPAGMALRFARVKGYRSDKTPQQADTVDAVRELFRATQTPGSYGPAQR